MDLLHKYFFPPCWNALNSWKVNAKCDHACKQTAQEACTLFLSIPKRFAITYLLYCFVHSLSPALFPTVTFDYLLRCPYLSCDIWIVASNIYLLYLHFNKSRVRERPRACILFEQSVREQERLQYRQEQHKNVCHKSYDFGWKSFFSLFSSKLYSIWIYT